MTDETLNYRRWLTGVQSDEALIETIQLDHADFPAPVRLANWDININVKLETGATNVLFNASRFFLEPPQLEAGPTAATTLVMSSYNGMLYEALADLPVSARNKPVTVTSRLYLSEHLTAPVYATSPPKWTLHSVVANWDVVQGDLQTVPLRTQKVGRYYTAREFPVFSYIR